ncbi:hypothetical protein HYH03_002332 [Edaphochlamys debaryana]|uniref:Small ribosomal subunit protein mS29 n=1 Tax=Edaphochlamys debaryana TaxID=47281 RepID=A0A835YBU0_9CHLO|nr:hypothetical protein HYH03_002332 [Edaphochlamys debaryana]|eukprot:KAG2500055.1 hypothetical protein HYH03_002332 [Edaphochlamys debaryana]
MASGGVWWRGLAPITGALRTRGQALQSAFSTRGYASPSVEESGSTPAPGPSSGRQLSVGNYYPLDMSRLPEAGTSYAGAFLAPRDPGFERRGGCKGLQAELEATAGASVMYRPSMDTLFSAVAARQHPRLLLTGSAGSGKSVALAALVEWARRQGWLAVYIPSCLELVRGGFFRQRDSRGWDTLTSAQQLLKAVVDVHGAALKGLPVIRPSPAATEGTPKAEGEAGVGPGSAAAAAAGAGKGARTLYDVAMRGLQKDDDAQRAVDSALALVRQLGLAAAGGAQGGTAARPRVLFALDDYNYLYGPSKYGMLPPGVEPSKAKRRVLQADELILARGMRLLDSERAGGATVVAATSTSLALPAPKDLGLGPQVAQLDVPPFSEAETRNALAHYHATGYAAQLPTAAQARQLFMLTQGNARELRTQAPALALRTARQA